MSSSFLFVFLYILSIKFKVWINSGDIILVSLRDYQDHKADVILKYLNDEARQLKAIGKVWLINATHFNLLIFSRIRVGSFILGEIPDTVHLDENNDIEFDANADLPDDEFDSDSDPDMPPRSDDKSSDEEEEAEDAEEEDGDEGAPFGVQPHYKGEFTGNTNRWINKKAYKKKR